MQENFSYNLEHKYRGSALIICNEFKGKKHERKGCAKDLVMMDELFTLLDFEVIKKESLKADKMKEELRKAAEAAENKDSDCFVLVISTHGEEVRMEKEKGFPSEADVWKHVVVGEDVDDKGNGRIFVEDIVDMFSDDNAPGLRDKPKLFFLQTCRSRGSSNRLIRISNPKYDQGYPIRLETAERSLFQRFKGIFKLRRKKRRAIKRKHWLYTDDLDDFKDKGNPTDDGKSDTDDGGDSTDEYSEDDDDNLDDSEEETDNEDALRESDEEDAAGINPEASPPPMPASPFDVVPISCPNDFLIMYSVMPGKSALKSPSGSYLLQHLHKGENLSKLLNGNNILQYLTSVSQYMAKYDFLPDLIMKGKPKTEKTVKLKGWIVSNIKILSKNKILLADVLGKKNIKDIKDEILVEEYLKDKLDTFTKKEMRAILRRILPFKMTACLVHRLRDNVRLYPKSPNGPMAKARAKAKKRLEESTIRK